MGASSLALLLWWESIFGVGRDCRVLSGHQKPSQGIPTQCYREAPQGGSQACRKQKTGIKMKKFKKKGKRVKFWDFSYSSS